MIYTKPKNCFTAIFCFSLILALSGCVFADSRLEDTRARPPERWAPIKDYGMDAELGGMRMQGNVDRMDINSSLDFRTTYRERHQLFLEWDSDYTTFGGNEKFDKIRGSILYAYALQPHVNIFIHSTYGHNDALKLRYRTKNGFPGVCFHDYFKNIFSTFMVSTSFVTVHEAYKNGVERAINRMGNRLNFSGPISEHTSYSSDFYYVPRFKNFRDYYMSWVSYLEFKITPDRLSFRVTVADEYESKPVVPGIRRNDLSMRYSVIMHLWR